MMRVLLALGAVYGTAIACGPGGGGGGEPGPPDAIAGGGAGGTGSLPNTGGGGVAGGGGYAGSGGAAPDATDGQGEADSPDGGGGDATVTDAAPDASLDAPTSLYCGDGIRGLNEECDDGNALSGDACTSACQVNDFLAVTPFPNDAGKAAPGRYLGEGRHPVAAGPAGFAVAYVEPSYAPPRVGLKLFDTKGVPAAGPITVSTGSKSTPLLFSSPVVASLPGGSYAVAWTDFNGDGDALGVALQLVAGSLPPTGEPGHANTSTEFSQSDPDVLWTGSELVVAWADDSDATTGPDLRVRTFDSSLSPTSPEQSLASDQGAEGNVALGLTTSGWAAAWRASSLSGLEKIVVKSGASTWSVGPHAAAPAEDKPAVLELDLTALLVVFTEGAGSSATIRGAVLPSNTPGVATAFTVGSGSSSGESQPNAVRVGSRVFLSWRSGAQPGDPKAEQIWLRELVWSAGKIAPGPVMRLPRWESHSLGDQRFPALAASSLAPEGALVAAWDDYGLVFGKDQGAPDVVMELIPTPIVRNDDGGGP